MLALNGATDPEEHPQSELYWGHVNPIGPRACYDEAKRVAETMCYAYQKQVTALLHLCHIFHCFPLMGLECSKIFVRKPSEVVGAIFMLAMCPMLHPVNSCKTAKEAEFE